MTKFIKTCQIVLLRHRGTQVAAMWGPSKCLQTSCLDSCWQWPMNDCGDSCGKLALFPVRRRHTHIVRMLRPLMPPNNGCLWESADTDTISQPPTAVKYWQQTYITLQWSTLLCRTKQGIEVGSNFVWVDSASTQSVLSWLKLELAQNKKLELSWLGSAQRKSQNPSLAWLGLKQGMNFWAELGSDSEEMEIYELSLTWARGKWTLWAWPKQKNLK